MTGVKVSQTFTMEAYIGEAFNARFLALPAYPSHNIPHLKIFGVKKTKKGNNTMNIYGLTSEQLALLMETAFIVAPG